MKRIPKLLILILVLALFLRLINLGSFPVGFHVDEARVAWNALSILKTGLDDRGNHLALHYNTFGDYRPTAIFYFTIPSLLLFGQTVFAVRFASAFLGALTIIPLYLLVKEITLLKNPKALKESQNLALISSFLLSISSWHLEVSRATSEVAISLFFALFALFFLVRFINKPQVKYIFLSCFTITISYFLYHSIRFLAPLLFLVTIGYFWREIKKQKKQKFLISCLAFVFLLTFLFSSTVEAKRRFDQVSILNDENTVYEIERLKSEDQNLSSIVKIVDNKYFIYSKRFLLEYLSYFNGDFLLGSEAKPYRYITPGVGLINYVEFILIGLGLWTIFKNKGSYLPLLLLLIAPLASALTTEDVPNLHRAFFMVAFLVIIESYGLNNLLKIKKHVHKVRILVFSLLLINFSFFLYMYFYHGSFHKPFIKGYSLDGSSYRNVGAIELAQKLYSLKDTYEKIVVSNSPDEIYPWYGFFNNINPEDFNKQAVQRINGPFKYQNIVFSQDECPSSKLFKNDPTAKLLVIDAGAPTCAYDAQIQDGMPIKIVDKIYRSNGTVVYTLLDRK